jgi:hypothetical protein
MQHPCTRHGLIKFSNSIHFIHMNLLYELQYRKCSCCC